MRPRSRSRRHLHEDGARRRARTDPRAREVRDARRARRGSLGFGPRGRSARSRRLRRRGVAVPGLLDRAKGSVIRSPNLHAWDGYPLLSALRRDAPPKGGVGERRQRGCARRVAPRCGRRWPDFILVTVGTGIGGGVILGGELFVGPGGMAGEMGHLLAEGLGPAEAPGRACGCGNRGCVETVASITGLLASAREGARKVGIAPPESGEELAAWLRGSKATKRRIARSAFDRGGRALGLAFAQATTLLDVRRFLVAGGGAASSRHSPPASAPRWLPTYTGAPSSIEIRRASSATTPAPLGPRRSRDDSESGDGTPDRHPRAFLSAAAREPLDGPRRAPALRRPRPRLEPKNRARVLSHECRRRKPRADLVQLRPHIVGMGRPRVFPTIGSRRRRRPRRAPAHGGGAGPRAVVFAPDRPAPLRARPSHAGSLGNRRLRAALRPPPAGDVASGVRGRSPLAPHARRGGDRVHDPRRHPGRPIPRRRYLGNRRRRRHRSLDPRCRRSRRRPVDHGFLYNRPVSEAISFGDSLASAENLVDALSRSAAAAGDGGLVLVATDGETFGHHKKNGAEVLAAALAALERDPGVELTTLQAMLRAGVRKRAVEIRENTAWSCAHGIDRWRSNCGCRLGATQQNWRAPLREAIEMVTARLHAVFERDGSQVFRDPWEARDASGALPRRPRTPRILPCLASPPRLGARRAPRAPPPRDGAAAPLRAHELRLVLR